MDYAPELLRAERGKNLVFFFQPRQFYRLLEDALFVRPSEKRFQAAHIRVNGDGLIAPVLCQQPLDPGRDCPLQCRARLMRFRQDGTKALRLYLYHICVAGETPCRNRRSCMNRSVCEASVQMAWLFS